MLTKITNKLATTRPRTSTLSPPMNVAYAFFFALSSTKRVKPRSRASNALVANAAFSGLVPSSWTANKETGMRKRADWNATNNGLSNYVT